GDATPKITGKKPTIQTRCAVLMQETHRLKVLTSQGPLLRTRNKRRGVTLARPNGSDLHGQSPTSITRPPRPDRRRSTSRRPAGSGRVDAAPARARGAGAHRRQQRARDAPVVARL